MLPRRISLRQLRFNGYGDDPYDRLLWQWPENRVIGDGKGLIWHIPDDLKRVKTLTMGCPLIMGRKTWDSIGRPLPGRASIVMTRDADWAADGAIRRCNNDRRHRSSA
jgi:dihydrofolate reductase